MTITYNNSAPDAQILPWKSPIASKTTKKLKIILLKIIKNLNLQSKKFTSTFIFKMAELHLFVWALGCNRHYTGPHRVKFWLNVQQNLISLYFIRKEACVSKQKCPVPLLRLENITKQNFLKISSFLNKKVTCRCL